MPTKVFTTPRRDWTEKADQAAVHERNIALIVRTLAAAGVRGAVVTLAGVTDHPDGQSVDLSYQWT